MKALFYVDALPAAGELLVVDGDEGFHAANVRRLRPGEEIDVSDGVGTVASCTVEHVSKGRLSARVTDSRAAADPSPKITVVQALPKSDRSELAIELATEAGADAFLGWQSERCVARWEGAERVEKGLRRWRAVARSAARQARRPRIPEVTALLSTSDLLDRIGAAIAREEVVLALHESATESLAHVPLSRAGAVTLIVGPEGGLSDLEVAGLTAAGARLVRLGPTVLRTSTAAAVALGALGVLTPRWGSG